MLAQLQVHKAEGYCKRMCDVGDQEPKPVIQVIVTEESSCGWVNRYVDCIRSIINSAWSETGKDY